MSFSSMFLRPQLKWPISWLWIWVVVLLPCVLFTGHVEAEPCAFNDLCDCVYVQDGSNYSTMIRQSLTQEMAEMVCTQVPFAQLPVVPPGLLLHFEILNSGLEVISNGDFGDVQIESLRLMKNNIRSIGERAFQNMVYTLRFLDLTDNELSKVPSHTWRNLQVLEWVNLNGNNIVELKLRDWQMLEEIVSTVYLSENHIDTIPPNVFSYWKDLKVLNLDNNNIVRFHKDTLSETIERLSINNNLLTSFPSEAVNDMQHLSQLYLRGNLIDRLPDTQFPVQKTLDVLDLGKNYIHFIPDNLFGGSVKAYDLQLDFNLISEIHPYAFRGINPQRLILTANAIKSINDTAFLGGPEKSLVILNLKNNKLNDIPKGLSQLKALRFFYVNDNNISTIDKDAIRGFCGTLGSLRISGNHLNAIPRAALENCSAIHLLDISYNNITNIADRDFETWGDSLRILMIRGNKLTRIPPNTFAYTPQLRELSLSYNRITDITQESLVDVLNTLQSLEISFGYNRDTFPEYVLKPLTALEWIAFDNNNIRVISETALYSFGKLKYFNMDNNFLTRIPVTLFHQNVHKILGDIRLSYNYFTRLEVQTFHNLEQIRNIVLVGNKITTIENEAFKDLPMLSSVLLGNNIVGKIKPRAFSNLPRLSKLDLHNNNLTEFSLNVFDNVTINSSLLKLNLSKNKIKTLDVTSGPPPKVQELDASFNVMKEVPDIFIREFRQSLQKLNLAHNNITNLDSSALGELRKLQILNLEFNEIREIRTRAFYPLETLQIMDISHNNLTSLPSGCFSDTPLLRILNLSYNKLRSLPSTVFSGVPLETMKISHNEFVAMPTAAFTAVSDTLHYLDISHNHLEHMDSTMFHSFPNLIDLNIAYNRLNILPDNVFISLNRLISLDLSGNEIRANFKEMFQYTQNLQKLNMASIGFTSTPTIPLPNLTSLNLSSSVITEVEVGSLKDLRQLRTLDLSNNNLTNIRSRLWKHMPFLNYLDLSDNPIESFTKEWFRGATRIETLVLKNLNNITRFDYDTLSHMKFLKVLYMTTIPAIEKYRFRVGHLLSTVHTLRELHLEVRDTVLQDQILGAFGPKLQYLGISGEQLTEIDSMVFQQLQNKYKFKLAITDTNISYLPFNILNPLLEVSFLSLDLSRNKLKQLLPYALYRNETDIENVRTDFFHGGIGLEGNDFTCDCQLVWVGKWLRRWLRETLQIHMSPIDTAQEVQDKIRNATCYNPKTGKDMPLLDLRSEDLGCENFKWHVDIIEASQASPLTSASTSLVVGIFLINFTNILLYLVHSTNLGTHILIS